MLITSTMLIVPTMLITSIMLTVSINDSVIIAASILIVLIVWEGGVKTIGGGGLLVLLVPVPHRLRCPIQNFGDHIPGS